MGMSHYLCDMLYNEAKSTYDTNFDVNDKIEWEKWQDHYLETADKIRQRMMTEGLIKSAEEMNKHIEYTKKMIGKV